MDAGSGGWMHNPHTDVALDTCMTLLPLHARIHFCIVAVTWKLYLPLVERRERWKCSNKNEAVIQ